MTTQAKTPIKRTTKAAPAAKPAEVSAAAPAVEASAPEAVEAPAPVPAPAPVVAAPAAAAPKAAAAPFAGFEFPKFELPKFDLPKFEFPTFDLPKFDVPKFDVTALTEAEIPAALREFAEKAVAQAKTNYEKLKVVAEETTDAMEDAYETTRAGAIEFSSKSIDAAKANSDATLGHAKDLLGVKTFAEAIELQSTFLRQQYEALSAQAKELQEMATKLAGDAAKPAKDVLGKTLEVLKKD